MIILTKYQLRVTVGHGYHDIFFLVASLFFPFGLLPDVVWVVTYICSYDHDKTFFDGYKTYLANTSHGFVLSSCYFSYFSF